MIQVTLLIFGLFKGPHYIAFLAFGILFSGYFQQHQSFKGNRMVNVQTQALLFLVEPYFEEFHLCCGPVVHCKIAFPTLAIYHLY